MWNGIAPRSKVLICPLDWGLGHVARSTAVAAQLIAMDCTVYWAAPPSLHHFITEHFPNAIIFQLPAYDVRYSAGRSQVGSMLKQWNKFKKTIRAENAVVRQCVQLHSFDVIISDHRYGCYHPQVKSVFLAHQLQILLPKALSWFQTLINKIHQRQLRHFQEIWIPDFPNQTLSGKLSSLQTKVPQRFIEPQSRFSFSWNQTLVLFPFDLNQLHTVLIASGPEPHKTMFIEQTKEQWKQTNSIHLIVSGQLGESRFERIGENLWQVNHLNTESLKLIIKQAKKIICRSGYTSVMDMNVLNKKAAFIPTPGQTEQIYLAQKHASAK